jgi:hypothetical protein
MRIGLAEDEGGAEEEEEAVVVGLPDEVVELPDEVEGLPDVECDDELPQADATMAITQAAAPSLVPLPLTILNALPLYIHFLE